MTASTPRLTCSLTSFDITVITRAKDGAPATTWLAQVWIVASRVEIDIFKNGCKWAESVAPADVLSTLRAGGSHKAHPYVARKIKALAVTAASVCK